MSLADILRPLREEIEADDAVREKVLPQARNAVRLCSQSIKASHRGQYKEAMESLSQAHSVIREAVKDLSGSAYVSRSRALDTAYQELAEAANVFSFLKDGKFTPPQSYGIPTRAYLTGLADTVGELRRACLDSLRSDNVTRAEDLLGFMEEIFDELHSLDFLNALIPDLRRKCDVARSLIERTRGDITSAVRQNKLVSELKGFEERIKDNGK